MRTATKWAGAMAACLMAASLLGTSTAALAAIDADDLPEGTELVQIEGQDVPVAEHTLSAEELTVIGENQTPDDIAAISAMAGESELQVQVLLDFSGTADGPVAAALVEPEATALACFPTTANGRSYHNVGGKDQQYGYCANWTGSRANAYQYRNQTSNRTHLIGPSNVNWQACPPNQLCTFAGPITLGYVSL